MSGWVEVMQGAWMGVVQGVTEFLPVSSTGHLILCKGWMQLGVDDSFEIFIQGGSVLAVLVEYFRWFRRLMRFGGGGGFRGLRGWGLLGATTVPAGVVGLLAHDWIKAHVYGSGAVVWALGLGGLVMVVVERWLPARGEGEGLDGVGWREALGVGIFQCLALIPGVSRSASTIIGGRVLGLGRRTATEYSFFAAVPVLVLAAGYSLFGAWRRGAVTGADAWVFAAGFLVSFLASLGAIRLLIRFVSRHTFAVFGYYRMALALFWLVVMD